MFSVKNITEYIEQQKAEHPDITPYILKLDILTQLWAGLNELLPEDVDKSPTEDGHRIANLIQCLFPNGATQLELRWLPDLLNPSTATQFSVAVTNEHYASLRETATRLKDVPELSDAHRKYLKNIAVGQMPFGVFSEDHSRWCISDANDREVVCNQYAVDQYLGK